MTSGEEQKRDSLATRHSPLATPKITDFGLAKQLVGGLGQTKTGDILGTPNYMAPEQAAGRLSQIGPATDIHALGAILYEMLTGRPPFGKETLLDTLEQVRSHEPTPTCSLVRDIPRDLEVICNKCLRKEPRQRYASALDLADDLRRFIDGEPIHARPLSLTERLVKQVKRHPLRAAAVPGVLLALALVLIFLPRPREEPTPPPEKPAPRVYTDEAIARRAAASRTKLFRLLHDARTPEGWIRNNLTSEDALNYEPWAHAQTVAALLRCPEGSPEEKKALIKSLDVLRGLKRITVGEVPHGWPPRLGTKYTQAEPMLWTCIALATALHEPDLLTGQTRRDHEAFLLETQTILETYAPKHAEDGWHIVAKPKNPKLHNTYVNILALTTLLELKRTRQTWKGSAERRDSLIAQTGRWLVRAYETNADPPGWYKDSGAKDSVIDGLTLQAYAVLLDASNEAGLVLPESLVDGARKLLLDCGTRKMNETDQAGWVSYPFTRHDGEADVLVQNLTYLWYPWSVEATVRWLEHARRREESGESTEEIRRVLGHLVVDLGEAAASSKQTFIFIPTERLYGLSSVGRE